MKPEISREQQLYIQKIQKEKYWVLVTQISLLLLFLFLWEFSVDEGYLNGFIFSSPSRIIQCFYSMTKDHSIFFHVGITLLETMISFFLIMFLTLAFAILLWWFQILADILEPYLVVLNSLPKSALAPILIVWLGNNMKTIIITSISIAVFGSILNLYNGFMKVDPQRLMLIRTLGGTKTDCLRLAVIPSCIPLFISLMKVSIGLSLVGVIIGEFLAARAGLGYLIIYGSQVFKMDWVMMSIIILCLIAMLLYKLLHILEKYAVKNM
ncbi:MULTISPECIES: ABC transporter permease [Anaerostipes]|uniref:ABC transporter permease n=1 Tax=Anaerostipes TaxID=207244 RepID=UPI000951AD43|nr:MULTISPECIES: ABC transporter permease [Anaerostipes]MCI5622552.1 ABC transporter permease [Anaerostipes sp.]OLR59050.1 sulfonate ABC transporter permease [Anaerostipes sp. 494a]